MAVSKDKTTPATRPRPAPTPAAKVKRRSPDHWRGSLGVDAGIHAACDIAHGWTMTAIHFVAEPVALSESDYVAAIAASKKHDAKGRVCIHPAAVGKAVRDDRAGMETR